MERMTATPSETEGDNSPKSHKVMILKIAGPLGRIKSVVKNKMKNLSPNQRKQISDTIREAALGAQDGALVSGVLGIKKTLAQPGIKGKILQDTKNRAKGALVGGIVRPLNKATGEANREMARRIRRY